MFKPRLIVLVGLILMAAASRLIPHPPNLAPIAAMALFGGAYFADKRLAFLLPLGAMLLSDVTIGFHALMPAVYGSFAITVCIGFWLRGRRKLLPIAGATLTSSILFFVITNFAVWVVWDFYPKSFSGLMACYAAAIPFFRNTLMGNAAYALFLFGGFALAEKGFPVLRESEVSISLVK